MNTKINNLSLAGWLAACVAASYVLSNFDAAIGGPAGADDQALAEK